MATARHKFQRLVFNQTNQKLIGFLSYLERELELNSLEAPDEMPINTVMQQATQQKSKKRKQSSHHCKKLGHSQNHCRQLK